MKRFSILCPPPWNVPFVLGCMGLLGCATAGADPVAAASTTAKPAARQQSENTARSLTPLERAERQWEKRGDAKDIVASIAEFRAVADGAPEDPVPWLRIAEAQHLLGRLLEVEQPNTSDAIAAFADGISAAREAKERARVGPEHTSHLALYWEAVNLAAWTADAGFVERVDHEYGLLQTLNKLQMNEALAHNARRALAGLLAMPASLEHRDLARSKALFTALVAEDPWDLQARAAFAATYAVAAQDRDVFEQQLHEIVERTSSRRGNAMERRLAARAASRLLRDATSLFE